MSTPTKTETLLGGASLTVAKRDGTTEVATVHQLSVRLYPQYRIVQENEPRMVELLCDRPTGWSDTITLASFEEILTEGDRINSDFFGRWLQRCQARAARMPKPPLEETQHLLDTLAKTNPALLERLMVEAGGLSLPTSSPSTPSPAA